MSITYSTYVGPYVRCGVGQIERAETRRACTNVTCENHRRTIWAPEALHCHCCGAPIGDVAYTVTVDAISDWDVRDALQDRLATPGGDGFIDWSREQGAHIWIPNIGDIGHHLEEHADFNLAEITAVSMQEELDAFAVAFQLDLNLLRQIYGREAVSVHWGIIQDYS